jgi:hypothetical protein
MGGNYDLSVAELFQFGQPDRALAVFLPLASRRPSRFAGAVVNNLSFLRIYDFEDKKAVACGVERDTSVTGQFDLNVAAVCIARVVPWMRWRVQF